MLEEGSFRGRTADFFLMFLFGGALMTVSFIQECFFKFYLQQAIRTGQLSLIPQIVVHIKAEDDGDEPLCFRGF